MVPAARSTGPNLKTIPVNEDESQSPRGRVELRFIPSAAWTSGTDGAESQGCDLHMNVMHGTGLPS